MKNNKVKNIFILIAIILSLFSIKLAREVEAATFGDYEYNLINDDTEVEITGYNGSGGDIIIPNEIEGKPVTKIASSWINYNGVFGNKGITSVVLPDTLEFIGYYAFGNNQISGVNIPSSVTEIEEGAFEGNNLSSIVIPGGVTTIKKFAFSNNQLNSVTLAEGVTIIEPYAFSSNQLSSISIPSTVYYLSGFSYNQITSVTVPNGVTNIGESAFRGNQLTSVTISDDVTTIGESAFSDNKLVSITIPDSVTSIGKLAFSDNEITSITMPEGIVDIGDSAFRRNQITSITIPESVTKIGVLAFNENQLTTVKIPKGVKEIGNGAFDKNKISSVIIDGNFEIYDYGVMGIFKNNQPLDVVFTDNVTKIPRNIFGYSKVENVIIPDSITSIGGGAFRASYLTRVSLPENLKSIENEAFMYNRLKSIIIPPSVTSIGNNAFKDNQKEPKDFIIYGEVGSRAEAYANSFQHTFIPLSEAIVESITVVGEGNKNTIDTNGGSLQMIANVIPEDAYIKDVEWSVEFVTGEATIDEAGLLTALKNGIVTVTATARDGSNSKGTIDIEISNQIEWKIWEPKYNVEPDKVWTVEFNKILDIDTIKEINIYITDEEEQIIPMFYYQNQQDVDKFIYIVPVREYKSRRTYTLWVKDLKAKDGSILSENIRMDFTVK